MERTDHAACCLNYGEEDPQLLITGGITRDDHTLQDVWILDVKFGQWREVSGDVSYESVSGFLHPKMQLKGPA